ELEGEFIIAGGLNGAVVRVDEEGGERYVGGALARLAPQGRGDGWGAVGAADRRALTYELVREAERRPLELQFALSALGAGADVAVISMDDVTGVREARQESLLRAMRDVRNRRCFHVWRPVLAVLSALEDGSLERATSVAVISQTAAGVATQRLTIRKAGILAPERRQVGRLHRCGLGFDQLLERARGVVETRIPVRTRKEELRHLEMPIQMAMGLGSASEIFRRWNGGWVTVPEMPSPSLESDLLPEAVEDEIADVDVVLVETLAEGPVRSHFASLVRKISGREPVVLASDSVARGALFAARRFFRGETVYFDFLPQISTIVQDGQGPKNFDLIPPDATLPAGRTYRSEVPARLGLQSGQDRITVYLKKELEDHPRKAVLSLPAKSEVTQEIRCLVEQAPAQGRARIMLESDLLQAPMIVDWDGAEEIEEDWETVLAGLEIPKPTVPSRLILPATYWLWRDQPNRMGLSTLLREAQSPGQPDWRILANKLSSREGGAYCVSSDGDLPAEASAEERELLAKLQKRALEHTLERAKGTRAENDNDALRFLTWLFRRCDAEVIPELLKALDPRKGRHPFVFHPACQRLIYQGLGRVLSGREAIRRVLDHLLAILDTEWNSMNHVACAAFLLSRTDDAPRLLERAEVGRLACIGAEKLRESIRSGEHNTLHYPPFLLVGLLRWRLVDNWALVAGTDPIADIMLEAVEYALPSLERQAGIKANLRRLHGALSDVREELKGEGRNPDLLMELATL
ncbi:MAG: hypothetical protein OXC91_02485, partial [Rhodobacteraceae bacterium]|nr:hypothetical protein [Paracoccaceae bacterium]